MKNINILDENNSKSIKKEDIKEIIDAAISMYGGVGEDIEVLCDNSLLNNVIEVFGKDIKISKYDDIFNKKRWKDIRKNYKTSKVKRRNTKNFKKLFKG